MSEIDNTYYLSIFLEAAGRALVELADDADDAVTAGVDAVSESGGAPDAVFMEMIACGYALPVYVCGRRKTQELGNDLPLGLTDMDAIALTNAGQHAAASLFQERRGQNG